MKIFKQTPKIVLFLFFLLIILAFSVGWFSEKIRLAKTNQPMALRVNSYNYIKPLLICNTSINANYSDLKPLNTILNQTIQSEKQVGHVSEVSVYFQDFNSDERLDINKDEKFHPASLGKVSIMLGIYRLAEEDPNIFDKKIKNIATVDANVSQEIKPRDFARQGNEYTVQELIEKMIKYSDNNSLEMLVSVIKPTVFQQVYQDLQLTIPYDPQAPQNFDFITTRDISYFFRVLYNSSYLTDEYSEKAMELLAQVDYKNGLVAGVPNTINVAHKFGLDTEASGNTTIRELHDCGIVYHPKNPYMLCVMTKSNAPIPNIETTIKNISADVWNFENKR